jgi:hypothetical protein
MVTNAATMPSLEASLKMLEQPQPNPVGGYPADRKLGSAGNMCFCGSGSVHY